MACRVKNIDKITKEVGAEIASDGVSHEINLNLHDSIPVIIVSIFASIHYFTMLPQSISFNYFTLISPSTNSYVVSYVQLLAQIGLWEDNRGPFMFAVSAVSFTYVTAHSG
jgi:hypothetical protein